MPLSVFIKNLNKTIIIPFKDEIKIKELIQEILKRSGIVVDQQQQQQQQSNYKLQYNSSDLYEEDSLKDLSINDQSQFVLVCNDNSTNTTTTTTPTPSVIEKPLTTTTTTTTTSKNIRSLEMPSDFDNITYMQINNDNSNNEFLIKAIDMIVLDVSGSMGSSAFEGSNEPGYIEMTRSEVSQAFFQTLLDKFVTFEVSTVVGLTLFGHNIQTRFEFGKTFDSFSNELGNVVANESSTRLYEAIQHAALEIVKYRDNPKERLAPDVACRIFLLTDGDDTTSINPYSVYQLLKLHNIVLDAIPIGTSESGINKLSKLTTATGGTCFMATSTKNGVALFEREALLMTSVRDGFKPFSLEINNQSEFNAIGGNVVETVERKLDASLQNINCVSKLDAKKVESISTAGTGRNKRILKEYEQFSKSADPSIFSLYLNPEDISTWKILMKGPIGSPYEGGHYILSVQLPDNYPFLPPKITFLNRIYHCNINSDGYICLDILKDQHSACITVAKVCLAIYELLQHPNASDPLDVTKAGLYRDNITEYNLQCKKWVQEYALLDDLLTKHNLN